MKGSNELPAFLGGRKICNRWRIKWPQFDRKDFAMMAKLLKSSKISKADGVYNKQLEIECAKRNGHKYAITVTSATVALELALKAMGIGQGDEVIVPGYTFYSSVSCVFAVGAVPVICDIDGETLTISEDFAECITPRTRAVIVVDLGGFSPDISKIRALIGKRDIKIIVDSAQSFGSIGPQGTDYGDAGVYSFQKSKNLTCGEGGALVTDDEALYNLAYSLHNCGRAANSKWYDHKYNGSNNRMSELCACLTVSQLRNFDKQAEIRRQNAEFIIGRLSQSKIFKVLQTQQTDRRRIYHFLPIYCNPTYGTADDIVKYIRSEGIPIIPSYEKTCDMQEAYINSSGKVAKDLSVAHSMCNHVVLIPGEVLLADKKVREMIVTAFGKTEKYLLSNTYGVS